jgi:hypothetical protein
MAATAVVFAAVTAGCGDDLADELPSAAPSQADEPIEPSSSDTTPAAGDAGPTVDVVASPSTVADEIVPDDVAVERAQQRYGGIDGICDDVYQDPSLSSGGNCLSRIADGSYGPNAYEMVAGYNPVGFVITYERSKDGWAIDQEIDTALIFADCDVPAPPSDADDVTPEGGIDIDFNKGDDRIVQWTATETTYIQAYGETTLKSEPYEVPAGYRLAGSGDLDGQTPDEYLVLADDSGEQIEVMVDGCAWVLVLG